MKYNIGLDLRTTGVGWSVTDESGRLIQKNNHHLYGASVFDEASTAEERKRHRIQRRQHEREKIRIDLLQRIMRKDVLNADPSFYMRLDEAALDPESRTIYNLYETLPDYVFEDKTGEVKGAGNHRLKIYQLRELLLKTEKKADIRYVYLAVSHILKHRGYITGEKEPESQKYEAVNLLDQFLRFIDDQYFQNLYLTTENISGLMELILEPEKSLEAVSDYIRGTMYAYGKGEDAILAGVKLLRGESIEITQIIPASRKRGIISFATLQSNQAYDRLRPEYQEAIESLQDIYSWIQETQDKKQNEPYVSEEMNQRFEQHRRDLAELKAWFKKYATQEEYQDFFHTDDKEDNYNAYTRSRSGQTNKSDRWNHCSQETFYRKIKSIFDDKPEGGEDAAGMLARMYADGEVIPNGFLPLQRIDLNSSITNARQTAELEKILDNQSAYYSSIRENKEKILTLATFTIPYFVGPLKQDAASPFTPWIRYKGKGKGHITPWEFEGRVDLMATAEAYIDAATNNCTYLGGEKVLPKHSMIYEEYMLLNELNTMYVLYDDPDAPAAEQESVPGSRAKSKRNKAKRKDRYIVISDREKQRLIKEIFSKQKKVSVNYVCRWLERNAYRSKRNVRLVTSNGKAVERFATTMAARVDMEKILGYDIEPENEEKLEKIIKWSTLYTDRKIYIERLREEMAPYFTEEQIRRFEGLQYTGWGRYSRALLCDPMCDYKGKKASVLTVMRDRHDTFMRIYHSGEYGLKKAIRERNAENTQGDDLKYADIDGMNISPVDKRAVWTAVRILQEITDCMREKPTHIFIRNMRDSDAEKRKAADRNVTRYDHLREHFKNYEKETGTKVEPELKAMLQSKKNKSITDAEYLYMLQLGRCLYSGEKIDLSLPETYFTDYAVPLYLSSDDTVMNNQVLVLRNKRTPGQPLSEGTIRRMRPFWERLRNAGMMTGRKFSGLIIERYDENTYRFFMKNQLMENSLLIEKMTWILRRHYRDSVIYGINARLTDKLRKNQELYKISSMNDMQQAFDAFLTAHIGSFVALYLAGYLRDGGKEQIIIKKYERNGEGDKNGVFITHYDKDEEREAEGKSPWSGAKERKEYIKTVYSWHDGYVTRKTVEYTGKYFHETLYRPNTETVFMTGKSGGRKQAYVAYMDIIQYKDQKGEEWKELINIPAYISAKKDRIQEYIETELGFNADNGYTDVKILKSRILLNQETIIDGHPYYLRSASEWQNAKQLYIKAEYAKTIRNALAIRDPWGTAVFEEEEEKGIREAAFYLVKKFASQYPIYRKLNNSLTESAEKLSEMPVQDLILLIRLLINSMGTHGERVKHIEKEMQELHVEGDNRITNKRLKTKEIRLCHRSVTGIYSQLEKI